jgi:6-pyruvoyltetrahydropterin/6-carboxytetrahydropterin synthase
MYSIQRSIEIDAGHRVPTHGSKCKAPHGHRYGITAEVATDGSLPSDGQEAGMVMDFGFLKEEMVSQIHDACDHAFLVYADDPMLYHLLGYLRPEQAIASLAHEVRTENKPMPIRESYLHLYVLPKIPTAENLAEMWFKRLAPRVLNRTDGRAWLAQLQVRETPNSIALYPADKSEG